MSLQYSVSRYSLDQEFITNGQLTIEQNRHSYNLYYEDKSIKVEANALHHPIKALENLRVKLEGEHASIISCNGCRRDVSYRGSGSYMGYILIQGRQATDLVNMFAPTNEIEKLCTIEQHKAAYQQWVESL
jgi:hypothetical protein